MMTLIDDFFSTPIAAGISGLVLCAIGLLLKKDRGRRWVLGLSLFLYARYMIWRLVYTLPTDDFGSMIVGGTVYLAELYGLCQFSFFTYQSWSPIERQPVPITHYPIVDIMVTVVDEPLSLLRQTLVGCQSQEYPKDRFKVYVLDDGHRAEAKTLAAKLGCGYIRRSDHQRHTKAGNLNHALRLTDGDLVAMFDVGHIPVRTFLKETVGFFDDAKVAIVQTPHHFYNRDLFQRNLCGSHSINSEQALLSRALQAGRDAHNGACFTGNGGLLRRTALEEIGGFQTETCAENPQTSMTLHAKGYKSCYLDRILSAGFMPDTFGAYLKQQQRQAMGHIQILLRDNPLTKRGLTFAQRIDYFGSIVHSFFGLPRVIWLVAPLASLLFDVPLLEADIWPLSLYFFSFYLASAFAKHSVSRGAGNPFWSAIHEIVLCFALSAVALKALAAPRNDRPSDATLKWQRVKDRTATDLALAWSHLITFGLLAGGLVLGMQHLRQDTGDPSLPISLFWGSANLLFLTIAMFVASEQTQGRRAFRLNRDFAGELFVDGTAVTARILNVNEHGAALSLEWPVFTAQDSVTLRLTSSSGTLVRLTGRIVRQERLLLGEVVAGLQFVDLDEATRQVLVDKIFGDPAPWEDSCRFKPGIASSLRSLLFALTVPWRAFTWERRRMLRIRSGTACRLNTPTLFLMGQLEDMSFTGVSARFPSTPKGSLTGSLLELPQITLKVSPLSMVRRLRKTCVRFRVESIEQGEQQWRDLHNTKILNGTLYD